MHLGLSEFCVRATADLVDDDGNTRAGYIRIRTRGRGARGTLVSRIPCTGLDPAELAYSLEERLEELSAAGQTLYVELMMKGSTTPFEVLPIRVDGEAGTGDSAPAPHADAVSAMAAELINGMRILGHNLDQALYRNDQLHAKHLDAVGNAWQQSMEVQHARLEAELGDAKWTAIREGLKELGPLARGAAMRMQLEKRKQLADRGQPKQLTDQGQPTPGGASEGDTQPRGAVSPVEQRFDELWREVCQIASKHPELMTIERLTLAEEMGLLERVMVLLGFAPDEGELDDEGQPPPNDET